VRRRCKAIGLDRHGALHAPADESRFVILSAAKNPMGYPRHYNESCLLLDSSLRSE